METTDNRNQKTRIALLDNDALALDMERRYFDRRFQHQAVIWTQTDPRKAITLSLADATRPDVLVVDMSLEGMTGAQVCRAIRTRTDAVALLGVTSFSLRLYGPDAVANGAQCLVSKVPLHTVDEAIGLVASGKWRASTKLGEYVSRETPEECRRRLLSEDARREAEAGDERWRELSDREWAALELCAQGWRVADIAVRMRVSDSSVKTYLARVRGKLGAADTADAVRRFRVYKAALDGGAENTGERP